MAKIYARWVKMGKRTIESVPEHWRAEVQAILDAENAENADNAEIKETEVPKEVPQD